MERFDTILQIISIQQIASEKEIRKRISSYPQFEQFIFPQIAKAQLKQAKKASNTLTITGLFDLIKFNIEFNPQLLEQLNDVYQQISKDNTLVHYLGLFTLYQYIGFIMQFETTFSISSILLVFQSLSIYSNLKFQSIVISAINDILSIIVDNYSHDIFTRLFDPLSHYLLNNPSVDESVLSFIPMLLKRVIDDGGYSAESDASRLSSLIALLFSNPEISFSNTTITFLFEIIKPHLYSINEFAFIIMQSIKTYLEVDIVNTFFLNLPSRIILFIEKNGTPFIKPPKPIGFESFTPTANPECHFRFPEVMTYVDGFDASSTVFVPSPSIVGLCNPEFYSLINMIVKVIGNSDDFAQIFLNALTELVENKSNTEFKYDYLGILVLLWDRLTDNLPIERIRFPKILFEPTISVFEPDFELSQVFFSMRFYAISSLLKVAEPDLDLFLLENVKYPRLFGEIITICNLNLDKVSSFIMKQSSMIRTIRLIGLQQQTAEFNNEVSTQCIESARTSLFRLLFRIFVNNYFVYCFLNDVLFLSFFASLLFEEGIRPFILTQLKIYLDHDLDNSQCELFLNQFCQVIDQANNILPSQIGLLLISDILSSFKTKNSKAELMLDLCEVLRNALQVLDDSPLSRQVLHQIIGFFTMISKATSKLPQECLAELEIPLKRFKDLNINDFNLMLCLLASDFLNDFQSTFSIKNGLVLSVMFRVFYKPDLKLKQIENTPNEQNAIELNQNESNQVSLKNTTEVASQDQLNSNEIAETDMNSNQAIDNGDIDKNYIQKDEINIVNYSLRLCKYSIQNCITCHKSGFDLTLLDFLLENRESDDSNIPTILSIITKIASVISSPIVVQKFISLFIPIESRYISKIHSHLLKPLLHILREARNYPSITFPLNHSYVHQSVITHKQLIEHDGFSFIFWLYYDTSEITHIFSLFNNEDKVFFRITMENDIILINGQSTYIHVPNKQWCFLAFTYQIEACIAAFFVESEEVWREPNVLINMPTGQISCRIGPEQKSKSKTRVSIGNFGFFPSYYTDLIKVINSLGPRSIQIKGDPFFYYTQENMRSLTGSALCAEDRTFIDILFQFFKVEILLPLFAQIDLKLQNGQESEFNVMDIVSIFHSVLAGGELEQFNFGEAHGFSIISYLLYSSDAKQVTYELYLSFYSIMKILVLDEVKKELFTEILLNFDIFIPSKDHLQILEHWGNVLFVEFENLFREYFTFSFLLDALRIYYWYEPLETAKIRGEPGSQRSRYKDLDVAQCRLILLNILFKLTITNDDFSNLIEKIISIEDQKQKLDLLLFIGRLSNSPQGPLKTLSNAIPAVSRLSSLLPIVNDEVATAVFHAIYSVLLTVNSNDISLLQLIDATTKDLELRSITITFLNEMHKLMLLNAPLLFYTCSYICYRLSSVILYEETKPSLDFTSQPNWAFWAIAEAITLEDEQKQMIIYSFLISSNRTNLEIFDNLISIITHLLSINCDKSKYCFLKTVLTQFLNSKDELPNSLYNSILTMVKNHIFYRRVAKKKLHSNALVTLYNNSPYIMSPRPNKTPKSKALKQLSCNDFSMNIDSSYDYIFGLRISKESKWKDEELAILTLKLIDHKDLNLGFLLCSFLIHSNPTFVDDWLANVKLTKLDYDLFGLNYLAFKCYSLGYPIKIQPNSSFIQVFDSISTIFYDAAFATSWINYFKGIKSFSHQASNSLYLIQQQESRSSESEYDLNQTIRSHLERNLKLWSRLWNNVVVNGAPWDASKITGKQVVAHWKRDMTCCKYCCPMKMKRNRNYTNHYESSIARDAGNQENINKMIDDYKKHLEEEYKKTAPPEIFEVLSQTESPIRNRQVSSKINKAKNRTYKCELIKITGIKTGTFVIYSNSLHINIESSKKTYILPSYLISKIYSRRRFHMKTAIEIFMKNGKSYFVNFPNHNSLRILQKLVLSDSIYIEKDDASVSFQNSGITEKWVKGEISNFCYLMRLNMASGRSFNDSSQYPFFPWILSNYESDELDLSDESNFRDLSKPIGAIDSDRLQKLNQRMNDLLKNSKTAECYLYSSFAICPLSLYLYLFRMEPFTKLHIDMQSGKFDHPSRLFSSIPNTYGLVSTHINDYRELIPEFFFSPEFMINENELDLGFSKGVQINHVDLPKWAQSAIECVYLFRKALESDYVSSHLNQWIDLVWGYKQKGEKAKEANNLFLPSMYETAWTQQTLKDPRRRAEIEAVMCHVGQIPIQLFFAEHPTRKINPRRRSAHVTLVQLPYADIKLASMYYCKNNDHLMLSLISCNSNRLVASVGIAIAMDHPTNIISDISAELKTEVTEIDTFVTNNEIVILQSNGKLIHMLDGILDSVHSDLSYVSTFAISKHFTAAVSDNTTLNLFSPETFIRYSIPFYGDAILCCAISETFKVAVCGTLSGLIICSLYEGKKIKAIQFEPDLKPMKLLITNSWGFIVTYAVKKSIQGKPKQYLIVHTINGKLLRSVEIQIPIVSWYSFSSLSDFNYLVISTEQGKLHLLEVFYLNIDEPFYRCNKTIVSICYLKKPNVIAALIEDGNIAFLPIDV